MFYVTRRQFTFQKKFSHKPIGFLFRFNFHQVCTFFLAFQLFVNKKKIKKELLFLIYEIHVLILSFIFRGMDVSGHFCTLKSERHCAFLAFNKTVWNMIYIEFTFLNYRCLQIFWYRLFKSLTSVSYKLRLVS